MVLERVVIGWLSVFKTVVSAPSEVRWILARVVDEVAREGLISVARIWRHLYPATKGERGET